MRLNDDEKAMLDGRDGPAVSAAMNLLVRYGNALGAERLVDTNNVTGTVQASTSQAVQIAAKSGRGMDAVFSEYNLDSREILEIPKAKVFSTHLQLNLDIDHAEQMGVPADVIKFYPTSAAFTSKMGVQLGNTCTPYQIGNVPTRGEHCAWMESSAVIYCNSVLGARTNAEGRESAGSAMLTGKIPYWGYHLDENRLGTHLIEVDIDVETTSDWGMLGYFIGEFVQEHVPVVRGRNGKFAKIPNLARLKHFGAAAASSGGVEMYHLIGVTPEALSYEQAFGSNKPIGTLHYGEAEKRKVWERLNTTGNDPQIDYVMLGCPHYTIEQIWEACQLLEGRKIHENCNLWIFTPRAIKALADQNGYTKIIEDAGGQLMADSCSAMSRGMPKGTKVVALDSAKHAHYLPAITGVQAWYGTTADCINAACTGRWNGRFA